MKHIIFNATQKIRSDVRGGLFSYKTHADILEKVMEDIFYPHKTNNDQISRNVESRLKEDYETN